ncbi:amine sulfotransferase-like [Mercenaria mercenaria]|uniref:amine sulfotransferase-like n=1 Tax=Mercenaria mercenaria TaxID=6596 RepID=UPI00234E9CA0|nr:amine sulfotransferase-like [Mercenaria mercenaria]
MSEASENGASEKPRLNLEIVKCRGILIAKCERDEIEKMEMRDDDIWVCTFPRSGTTLTQELVYLIETLDFEKAKSVQLDDRFPIIDVKDDRFPYYRGVKFVEQMPSPRMVKAHAHFDFLPEQLQNGKGRIIYLARNPKDVITSYFHLLQWLDELRDDNNTWTSFFNSFIDGTALHCPWPRHVLKYWERRNDSNVLFLKYEELVKDLPKGVRTIAKFLGKDISDENVARICDHCSVENMKKNDKVNLSYWRDVKKVNDDAGGGFINKGKAGAWKHVLTQEESEKIDILLKEVEKSGLTFELH